MIEHSQDSEDWSCGRVDGQCGESSELRGAAEANSRIFATFGKYLHLNDVGRINMEQ